MPQLIDLLSGGSVAGVGSFAVLLPGAEGTRVALRGPVRVVIPRLYFWKSPKWVTRIELLGADRPGFWEVRGYHNNGDPWTEERYAEP